MSTDKAERLSPEDLAQLIAAVRALHDDDFNMLISRIQHDEGACWSCCRRGCGGYCDYDWSSS